MSAVELMDEAYSIGIQFQLVKGGVNLVSAEPIPDEIVTRLRRHKPEIISILRKYKSGKPFLVPDGSFRCSGLWEGTLLDAMLEVGASESEIDRHLDQIGMPKQWHQWKSMMVH